MFLRSSDSPHAILTIREGRDGVRDTLRIMRDLVKQSRVDPDLVEFGRSLVSQLPEKHYVAEVEAIHRFVRDNIRYVRDVDGVETVASPQVTLAVGQGDCDDKSVLAATLLNVLGHEVRFKAVGFQPGHLSHVYVETLAGKRWIPVDTTERVEIGWQPGHIVDMMVEHV